MCFPTTASIKHKVEREVKQSGGVNGLGSVPRWQLNFPILP